MVRKKRMSVKWTVDGMQEKSHTTKKNCSVDMDQSTNHSVVLTGRPGLPTGPGGPGRPRSP